MPKRTGTTLEYMQECLQDSLITGIPQIVQTRNKVRKVIKSIVLLACVIGFVYQTTEFLKIFWSYPTVLDIDVEYPEIIESPAITFCNMNGVKRTEYCQRYPSRCTKPKNLTAFCEAFPVQCKRHSPENLEFPIGEGLRFEQTASKEDLQAMGHNSSVTLQYCTQLQKDGHDYLQCSRENLIYMPMSDGNTGYRNCYTIFSGINSRVLNQHQLPVPKRRDALFHMAFDLEPEEYFRPDREVGAIIAIHSPYSVINPFFDGFVIQPGNLYSVHLKVVEEKLLPSPYETQCQDYRTTWKNRGRKGPLSREMCLAECIYNSSMQQCNCVIPDILFPHNDRVCTYNEMDCFDFNITRCYKVCQQPCDFTDFEYEVKQRKMENSDVRTIEEFYQVEAITSRRAALLIFLKRPEIIIYSHRPQYEDIEIFSFIGGYVGMWLGVSLVAVFDFLENIALITHFWIKKKISKNN